jgi:lipoyl-dependent peroxiredoxin
MRRDLSYTTTATATAGESTRVRSDDGRLELALCTPVELGGSGGDATNAEQLLASGYAACFFSALQYAAARRGTALPTDARVRATVELSQADQQRFAVAIRIEPALPGLEPEIADRLIDEAKIAWPYSEPAIALGPPDESEARGQHDFLEAREDASGARGYGG